MKRSIGDKLFDGANALIMLLFSLCCIYPFYYLFIYSISDPQNALDGLYLWPEGFSLKGYSDMLQLENIYNAFIVSAGRTVIGTLLTVLACAFFAYLVTKQELIGRKIIYRFVIITMYLNAGLIPWYITMKELGLKNSFLLYIIPSVVVAFYVILIKTFIEQIPASLEESAMIDGAGYLTIFFRVLLPVSMPIVATVAVFQAVNQWNSWTDNMFLVSDKNLQTLQYVLYKYLSESEAMANETTRHMMENQQHEIRVTPQSIKTTITMLVTLPILIVYPFMQRYFVKGIMLGAVKG